MAHSAGVSHEAPICLDSHRNLNELESLVDIYFCSHFYYFGHIWNPAPCRYSPRYVQSVLKMYLRTSSDQRPFFTRCCARSAEQICHPSTTCDLYEGKLFLVDFGRCGIMMHMLIARWQLDLCMRPA